ncbi:MAG: patatin, partial [Brevundimonas sp.]|nr:patatin [Brevundimonas sp.]
RGSLPSVFARSYQSMTQSLLRTSLAAQGAFARRNGMRISVAAIPQEVEASALDFDQDAMKALFEEGRRRAVSGSGWVPLDAEVVEPPSPQDAEPAPDAR